MNLELMDSVMLTVYPYIQETSMDLELMDSVTLTVGLYAYTQETSINLEHDFFCHHHTSIP